MYRSLILFVLIFWSINSNAQLIPTYGNSRTGGSGFQFLKIPGDPRSMAMGGAATGLVNDASAMYWNPAGMTGIDSAKLHIQLNNTLYFSGNRLNNFGLIFKPGKYSYLGFSINSMQYADMDETTEFQPDGTGRKIILSNYVIGLSFARILTESFSFGLTGKWAHEGLGDVSANAFLFDLGLMYRIGLMGSRFGVSFSNFGMNVSPNGEINVLKLSGIQKINSFGEISAPASFRLGFAFEPYQKGMHCLTLAAQLSHPTDNNETFSIGAEYSLKKILFVRSGWEFGSDESYSIPPLGFGLKIPYKKIPLRMDYAYTAKNRLGNMNRIGLIFNIQ